MKTRTSLILCVVAVFALGLAGQANAALYFDSASSGATWDDGITSNWGAATGGPYTSPWAGGSDAVFEGTAGAVTVHVAGIASVNAIAFDVTGYSLSGGSIQNVAASPITVTVGPGITGTIGADMNISGVAGVGNPALVMGGGGNLILGGTVTADDSLGTQGYVSWEGGGTLTISGMLIHGTSATQSCKLYVGSSSANNTMNVTGRLDSDALYIGDTTFGGNILNVSGPGDSVTPTLIVSGKNNNFWIGVDSSNNSVNFSNGSYTVISKGSGAPSMPIGANAGANGNSLTCTGPGTIVRGYMELYVGKGGDNNTMTVSNGGVYENQYRSYVGQTGSNNSALITGDGSLFAMHLTTNNVKFGVGTGAGATNNSLTVADGASALIGAGRSDRELGIGWVTGADNNYIRVTGTGSLLTISHLNALSIGGKYINDAATDSDAAGNHLDVYSGATANLKTVYLQGVNSAFNLGDGMGISEATVGKSSGAALTGVVLANADSRLNINSGKLMAGVDGSLVSGTGQVQLNGPAIISTAFGASTISNVIAGGGSLTKEDIGTLILSGANIYTGDTTVSAGTLEVTSAFFDDASTVNIDSGAVMNLNTTAATDTILALYLGGAAQAIGTWGSSSSLATYQNDTYFSTSGTGILDVVPEPATLALLGLGGLVTLIRRRRR